MQEAAPHSSQEAQKLAKPRATLFSNRFVDNLKQIQQQRTIDEMNALEARLQNEMEDIKKKLEGLRGIKEMVTEMAVNSIMVEGV